jgi:hypothetical protein
MKMMVVQFIMIMINSLTAYNMTMTYLIDYKKNILLYSEYYLLVSLFITSLINFQQYKSFFETG